MEPDQWGSGGAALQKPNDYNEDQLQSMFDEKTDRHLERQVEVANTYQNLAYEVAQGFGEQAA
ncbi:hypothetical protein [Fodinibius sp.]|uniref:hypothetical protein n=1 Tax=Fodinibius sp. TaxID=1872440 RepID=UPI002ACDB116|nr:hypothetical protein [Fodinibius sp.]MDZ7658071.1 hypothetical protein [Fodinibius sp.]